jgi:HD-GYP domain-containing protein (c-di-GMP phosphodiesterase class II)
VAIYAVDMSVQAVDEPDRLRLSFAREATGFARAERRAEIVVGGGFVIAAVALALATRGQSTASPGVAAIYVLMLAVAGRVRFDFGAGFTVPTQIVFVPMLFALPVGQVPLLVALALGLGAVPDIVSRKTPASRALVCFANSWFAIGPAVVLAAGGAHSPSTQIPLLVTALAAQVTGDFCSNALRERLRSGISVRELADEMSTIYLIDVAFSPVGMAVAFATQHRPWAILLMLPLFAVLGVFSRERRARLDQLIELNDAYRGTALVLGDVVESDDAYTGEHCKGVVRLALDVAAEMGLDAHQRRCIEFGALLHDVGKLAVPKEIINKPGALDEREWSIIKLHTIEGQRLLERVGGIMCEVGVIVRSSHERWDGDGYPDGLRGAAIPLEARIVSACDAYNAMTTTRSYRRAMSPDEALAELRRNAGTQFDPAVVNALLRVLDPGAQERAA